MTFNICIALVPGANQCSNIKTAAEKHRFVNHNSVVRANSEALSFYNCGDYVSTLL
jgi:hypothetical protein